MVAAVADLARLGGAWPRLLSRDQAAAYCGVSTTMFERDCPVEPIRPFGNRTLWDRHRIDAWLDTRSKAGHGLRTMDQLLEADGDADARARRQ